MALYGARDVYFCTRPKAGSSSFQSIWYFVDSLSRTCAGACASNLVEEVTAEQHTQKSKNRRGDL
jgi:hypothetical protein